MTGEVVILGCGYTGSRVRARLQSRGITVRCSSSAEHNPDTPAGLERLLALLTPGCTVLHSIPTLPYAGDRLLVSRCGDLPARMVYLSTTGVYGAQPLVDCTTPAAPDSKRGFARRATETAVVTDPWSSLILRPAAIYGPGRGAHLAVKEGRYRFAGDGSNFISRIYVDDLAALADAALFSSCSGAFPVADEQPEIAREIGDYCARLLGLPPPQRATLEEIPETRRQNRRVDGRAIFRLLEVELKYKSYKEGIPAALEAEAALNG